MRRTGSSGWWWPCGVETGQEQEVGGERLEPFGVLERAGHQVGAHLGVGVGERHLQLGPQHGEGAAELVGGVGDEAALSGAGRLQAFEHGVHGVGEAGDLVVAARVGNAPVEVPVADGGHLGADRLDRPQGAAGRPPGEGADREQQDGAQGGEGARGEVLGGVRGAQGGPDMDGGGPGGGGGGDRGDALVVLVAQGAEVEGVVALPVAAWG